MRAWVRNTCWLWLAVAVYCLWPVATNPGSFNHDELDLAHHLARGAPCWRWSWFVTGDQLFYRPLGFALFSMQLWVSGGPPWSHWLSLLHHGVNCALCAWVFVRLGAPARAALPAAFLPTAITAVAWSAAVYDRAALTFLLLGTAALGATDRRALLALPCAALALTAKESAVAFPVVAWVLTWQRPGWPRRTAVLITALAAGFVAFRLTSGAENPAYRMQVDGGAALRLLRYAAFPYALDAVEPHQVYGHRWLPGLLGIAALAVLAVLRAPRSSLAAIAIAVGSLLPVAFLPRLHGHYMYFATPAAAWLVWAACGVRAAAAAQGARSGLLLPAFAGIVLIAPLALHSRRTAEAYHLLGTSMRALGEAHRALPAGDRPVDLVAAEGMPATAAIRFAEHVEHVGGKPLLRIAESSDAPDALILDPSGRVRGGSGK